LDSHRFLKFCYLDSRGAHSYWVWLTILLQKNSGSKPNRLQTNRIARRNSLVSRKSTGKYPTCTERSRLAIDCEIKLACTWASGHVLHSPVLRSHSYLLLKWHCNSCSNNAYTCVVHYRLQPSITGCSLVPVSLHGSLAQLENKSVEIAELNSSMKNLLLVDVLGWMCVRCQH
jgi:hypothetical protein